MTQTLTSEQRTVLLAVAAHAVRDVLIGGDRARLDPAEFDATLRAHAATFVTLERGSDLLGCIGSLEPVRPLVADVAHNAVAAAFSDPRLPPVTLGDYEVMAIEISVLGPLEPIAASSVDALAQQLHPGTDGVVVESGGHRATFLPAVWRHFGTDTKTFLAALWRKAGLAADEWRPETRCQRYVASKLIDPGPRAPAGASLRSKSR